VLDPALVSDAVVWWTGWGRKSWPSRDDDAVVERFGEDAALDILLAVKGRERDLSTSTTWQGAPTLAKMGERAAADFRLLHPDVS
jgi:hypothetical protein